MNPIELYQQVAEAYHAQAKYQERDRFLVLALDAAHTAGQNSIAEQIRLRLLELNPNHLIKPYATTATALQSSNFVTYSSQLRKNFPPAKAQALLRELGGPLLPQPKRTMLADSTYPTAVPAEDPKTPTWSQVNVDIKPKTIAGPNIGIFNVQDVPRVTPTDDPLANVPVNPQPPAPFNLAPAARPARHPEFIPAPRPQPEPETDGRSSAAGIWIGNILFVLIFLASLATLAYIFVLPFYPEVSKMLKHAN